MVAVALASIAGCALPNFGPDPDRRDDVSRAVQSTTLGPVAALWAGEEGAQRLVLVHGTPGNGASWGHLLADPPAGFEVVALDRPGFAESEHLGVRPHLLDQAAAVEPFIAVRGGRGAILVGHSYGGPVVLDLATRYADRVGAVVVVSGSVDPALEEWRWFNVAADLFAWLLPAVVDRSNEEVRALEGELEDLAARLDRVRCPVVILHGVDDRLVPYENVAFLRAALGGTSALEVVAVEDAGHFVPWTHPDLLRSAIERARSLADAAGER